jgi:hypothetical protein
MKCSLCEGGGKIERESVADNMDVYQEVCPECNGTGIRLPKLFDTVTYKGEKCEVRGGKIDEKGIIYILRIDRGAFYQMLEVREQELLPEVKAVMEEHLNALNEKS